MVRIVLAARHLVGEGARVGLRIENGALRAAESVRRPSALSVADTLVEDGTIEGIAHVTILGADARRRRRNDRRLSTSRFNSLCLKATLNCT